MFARLECMSFQYRRMPDTKCLFTSCASRTPCDTWVYASEKTDDETMVGENGVQEVVVKMLFGEVKQQSLM